MCVTDFKVESTRGEKVDADPFGNNIAFACFSCKHPVLAIAREHQRGKSKENPAICRGCEAKYFIHVERESKKVIIASLRLGSYAADESAAMAKNRWQRSVAWLRLYGLNAFNAVRAVFSEKFCGLFRRYSRTERNAMKKFEIRGNFPYWGIDGCKAGWLCVGLSCEGEHCVFVAIDIRCAHQMMKERKAKIALIDIPIGLSGNKEERKCDKGARRFIGKKRGGSVFRVPCRPAMDAYKKCADHESGKNAGKKASIRITDGSLSEQTWAIAPKIAEVDSFLQCSVYKNNKEFKLRETHPEVCFRALNPKDADLEYSKMESTDKEERRKILASHLTDARKIDSEIKGCLKSGVADDDILDAMVAAVTAKMGFPRYETLPSENPPKDSCCLPMEMVFSKGKSRQA